MSKKKVNIKNNLIEETNSETTSKKEEVVSELIDATKKEEKVKPQKKINSRKKAANKISTQNTAAKEDSQISEPETILKEEIINPPEEIPAKKETKPVKRQTKKVSKNEPAKEIAVAEKSATALPDIEMITQAEETNQEISVEYTITEKNVVEVSKKVESELSQTTATEIAEQQPSATIEPLKKSKNKKKKKKKKPQQDITNNIDASKPEIDYIEPQHVIEKSNERKQIQSENRSNLVKQSDGKPQKKDIKPNLPIAKPKKKVEYLYSILPKSKELTKNQLNDDFINSFLNKVEEYLKQQAYIETGGKLLLAVSGGVDSIVMMDAMALLADRLRFSLYVAHFNHKLRGLSSDNDEVLVRNKCKEYNLHFYSGSGNVKQYSSRNSLSIEHAARILRYNFFERTARNIGVDIVSTAHTEDDLVETFFINLFRGSGLTGLSSMPSKRKFVKNVSLVRPFLQFSKSQLYKYAEIRNLQWNEDETNTLLNYTRNKVRQDLIPKLINEYNPALINIITRTTELIQGADEVIKDIVSKSINNVIDEANNERFGLRINMLLTFNKFMQGELIQHAWGKYFRLQPLPLSTIDRILELNQKQTGSICEISSGYYVLRDRNNLIFAKRVKDIPASLIIEKPGEYKIGKYKLIISEVKPNEIIFSEDKNIEYIPADMMKPFLEIRNKKDGDLFFPLGAPGEMKLSDFLTNEKVPLIDKSNILVLTNKFDILWVIGYRINEKCRVNKSMKNVLKLKLVLSDKK